VRGDKPEASGRGRFSKAAAMANAEFKHKRDEMWLLKGKGWKYSVAVVELEVEDNGETDVERPGTWVGNAELQPHDDGDEELRES